MHRRKSKNDKMSDSPPHRTMVRPNLSPGAPHTSFCKDLMSQEEPQLSDFTTHAERPQPAAEGHVEAKELAIASAKLLHDFQCDDIRIFDVTDRSEITHYIVIASGTSDRQIKALGGRVEDLAAELGHERFGHENDEATTWLVMDFVEVMVHLFEPATRAHYDLEMMWDDAPRIDWRNA